MSCKVDLSKRTLPNEFVERVVANMAEVCRKEFSVDRSVSDLVWVAGSGRHTQGVLNMKWQAVMRLGQPPFQLIVDYTPQAKLVDWHRHCTPCSSAAVALPSSSALSCRNSAPLCNGVVGFI